MSWILSALLLTLGILMILKSRRLANEALDLSSSKNKWRLIDLPRISNSKVLMQAYRFAFILVGIGIVLVAVTQIISDVG
jgi:hypothetical protein